MNMTTLPTSSSRVFGPAAVVLAFAAVLACVMPVAYRGRVDTLREQRGWTSTPQATRDTRAAQAAMLASYAWIDRNQGVVALPIERAMELVVAESARRTNEEVQR